MAIAHMGSPEDAMFVALTIRDGILKSNIHSQAPLYVRFGINLGPVRIVSDINGHPNIIGDGINVAQRIMSFAEANEILVSRSYYEITSRLTLEFSEMFVYSGLKHDKHVREHEVYSVCSYKEHAGQENQPLDPKDDRRLTHRLVIAKKLNWQYAVLALPVVIALGLIIKVVAEPSQPIILVDVENATEKISSPTSPSLPAEIITTTKSSNDGLMSNETVENLPLREATSESLLTAKIGTGNESGVKPEKTLEQQLADKELVEAKLAKKMAKRKAKQKAESELIAQTVTPSTEIAKNVNSEPKPVVLPAKTLVNPTKTAELKTEKVATSNKTGWDNFKYSIKQGTDRKCTQAEISLGQCH